MLCSFAGSSVFAQSISSVTLSVDSSTIAGKCPHHLKFKAVLISTGHLKQADLKWRRSDGTVVNADKSPLSGTGTDTVTYEWPVSSAFSGSLTLEVSTDSNHRPSNKVSFTITCK